MGGRGREDRADAGPERVRAWVCTCACIHVRGCARVRVHARAYMRGRGRARACAHTHRCARVCTCACMHVRGRAHVRAWVCTCCTYMEGVGCGEPAGEGGLESLLPLEVNCRVWSATPGPLSCLQIKLGATAPGGATAATRPLTSGWKLAPPPPPPPSTGSTKPRLMSSPQGLSPAEIRHAHVTPWGGRCPDESRLFQAPPNSQSAWDLREIGQLTGSRTRVDVPIDSFQTCVECGFLWDLRCFVVKTILRKVSLGFPGRPKESHGPTQDPLRQSETPALVSRDE